MSAPPLAAAGLEAAVNRLLAMDAELAEGLAGLQGRVLEVHVEGFDWRFRVFPSGARLRIVALDHAAGADDGEADVVVRAPPFTLLRLLASVQSIDGVLPREVSISGDLELVEKLSGLARRAYIDWEEPLASALGDSLGHEVARGLRGFAAWARGASQTLALDVGEYLREERRLTPTRIEIEDHANDVDVLRDDVERLEARVERLVDRLRSNRR